MESEIDWNGWMRLMQRKLSIIGEEFEERMRTLDIRERYELYFKEYPPRIEIAFGAASTRRDPNFRERYGKVILEALIGIANSHGLKVQSGYRKFDDAPWIQKMRHFDSDYEFTIRPVDYSDEPGA